MGTNIYIGAKDTPVSILKDKHGSFENTDAVTTSTSQHNKWRVSSYADPFITGSIVSGGKSGNCLEVQVVKTTTSYSTDAIRNTFDYNLKANHVYYLYCYIKGESTNNSTARNMVRLYDVVNSKYYDSSTYTAAASNVTDWTKISSYSVWKSDVSYAYATIHADVYNCIGQITYFDEATLIDLTELYGEGNEPTFEWCEANINNDTQLDATKKVKNLYIGVNNKARKIKKAYIGVNGKARLFYEYKSPEQLIPFTSNPVPTTWSVVTAGTQYTADNTYGTWEVKADNVYSTTSNTADLAFDSSDTTYYRTTSKSSTTAESYIYLTAPNGVSINPQTIYVKYRYFGIASSPCILQASEDNQTWDDLKELSSAGTSASEQTISINTSNYYRYYRVKLKIYSSSYLQQYLYSLRITKGTLKIG